MTVIDGEAVPDLLWLTNYSYPPKAPRSLPFDGELIPVTEGKACIRRLAELPGGYELIEIEEDEPAP